MKFGRNLSRNQVPEWSSSYINYKGLKKLIKSVAAAARAGKDADLARFFFSLDRNLENVDGFYNKKYTDSVRRLKLLQDRYGDSTELPQEIDKDEAEDLMGALLELRGQLRKLQWYGEVNRRGFVKITKKLDKKVPDIDAQKRYLNLKVDPKPFATNAELLATMQLVNTWLSTLSDAKLTDDSGSVGSSTHSMKRVSSRAMLNMPPDLLGTVDQAIRSDDRSILSELLFEANAPTEDDKSRVFQQLLLNLLQRAVTCRSKSCIDLLLEKVESLDEEGIINRRNCIHRLIITMGRMKPPGDNESDAEMVLEMPLDETNFITPAAAPVLSPPLSKAKERDGTEELEETDEAVQQLRYLLDHLRPHQQGALEAKDTYGRMPLHYAAQFGFATVSKIIIGYMQRWGQFNVEDGIDGPHWQDLEGYAPLHLSVIGGHPRTTKTLLEAEGRRDLATRRSVTKSSAVLALAVKANFVAIVKLLVDAGVDINYQDEQGETALHVAARFGHEECARILLEGTDDQRMDIEIAETTFGWTALFVACVDGNLPVVDLLIDAGADTARLDSSGWTAKEHAALRGHIAIARKFDYVLTTDSSESGTSTMSGSPPNSSSFEDKNPNGHDQRTSEAVKDFGHRYLTNESLILVSLGTMDTRRPVDAVKLDRIPLAHAHSTQLDTALSVVVSATGASGESSIIDLPVHENISTDPIVFTAQDPSKVKLLFDIVPTYAGSKDQIVGRGVALLGSVKPSIGSKRITLQGDVNVPVMAANTLDVIGTVVFNFLIITPFTHPNMSVTENQTYWKSLTSEPMVIGHRGLGKNQRALKSLQLGENTIQSFIAAANLGASYVEFDVQLTKDHHPVVYHDFLVSETGIDAPVHTLTLEQFLHVNDGNSGRPSRPSSPSDPDSSIDGKPMNGLRKTRSLSVGNPAEGIASEMSERMKHTRDFKTKGFKANSRGQFIQAPFTTLEQMFKELPPHLGFNIEMKYPMLHESEEQEMDTYAVELNSFVDTVLTKVYDLGRGRSMLFSSFNPDICLLLSFKQPSIPILFLTDAGTSPVGDIRASSLQEAVRFASRWNLLGVVTQAEPLVLCPRLVKVVKESGLVCVSYGTANNDSATVRLQVKEGIDAVIVDNVLAIRQGLVAEGAVAQGAVAQGAAAEAINGVLAVNGDAEGNEPITPAP